MTTSLDVENIDDSIRLLKTYLDDADTAPLITALEALKQDTKDETLLRGLTEALDALEIPQGAILTYAPYISVLLSDDPFEFE